jgi:hypothetical protein
MVKWDQAVSKPGFLKQSSLDQIHRPTSLAGGGTCAYGLGWNLDYLRGRRDYNHRGSNAGFSATLHRYVDDGLSVIVLANLAGADLERIARGVAGCMVPEFRLLSLMKVRPDPHPSWSDRLREGLFSLSRGEVHSAFSPEFAAEFRPSRRAAALASRLENLKSFSFLDSRPVGHWRGNRPGGRVERLEYYRLVSGARTQGYVFSVGAEDRVLWMEVEEDRPRLSEMGPSTDEAPLVTQEHQDLARGWATGVLATSRMTPDLKAAFTEDVLASYQRLLDGMTGVHFIASLDLRGDQTTRLNCEITEERVYRIVKPARVPLYMICFVGVNGQLADVELIRQ